MSEFANLSPDKQAESKRHGVGLVVGTTAAICGVVLARSFGLDSPLAYAAIASIGAISGTHAPEAAHIIGAAAREGLNVGWKNTKGKAKELRDRAVISAIDKATDILWDHKDATANLANRLQSRRP